ncbi:hypothetical protein IAU60_006864 [Kwoniella sp. DSM 27419]
MAETTRGHPINLPSSHAPLSSVSTARPCPPIDKTRPFAQYTPLNPPPPQSIHIAASPSSMSNGNNAQSDDDIKLKKKRKSWFSFRRIRSPPESAASDQPATIGAQAEPPSAWHDPQERFRPIQFAPSRIQTLYVTKSERDLYLAAMAQLDQAPPPLPLWSDPAPSLPQLPSSDRLPPMSILNGSVYSHGRSMSEGHPLTARPLSPKLVYSPNIGLSGLLVRDEFRKIEPPRKIRHALLALVGPSSIRLTGFPPLAVLAVDATLRDNTKMLTIHRSDTLEAVATRGDKEVFTWTAELNGKVWKRKGSEELDSIRLLLSLLSTLGAHGWTLSTTVRGGGTKKDVHNLLFTRSNDDVSSPPLFFALSMPVADRISLVSAPTISTPAILSAIRQAMVASTRDGKNRHSVNSAARQPFRAGSPGSGAHLDPNGKGDAVKGVKLEGWVHDGVYRFWIDGMRRWFGGSVKRRVLESLQPRLLVAIVNNLSALHFRLAGSIPLQPFGQGRDILFFQSLPASGLTLKDTWAPRTSSPTDQIPSRLSSPDRFMNAQQPTKAGTIHTEPLHVTQELLEKSATTH